jgi:chromate transporter
VSISKDLESKECNPFSTSKFLKDVFMCSLVAFGGPEAHLGVFLDRMVQKKKYLSEKALLEWMALCSFLPGPTSTQVITAIGLEKGGRKLALLTLIIWAFPAICVMSFIALLPMWINDYNFSSFTGFLAPMATAFVALAAWVLGKKVITNFQHFILWSFGLAIPLFSTVPWIIPIAFVVSGLLSSAFSVKVHDKDISKEINFSIPWGMLTIFSGLLVFSIFAAQVSGNSLIQTFERFFRYGYLVFGGGQVVVPLMQNELVNSTKLMTQQEFLSGFGIVQSMPGPMFSFAAYASGLSEKSGGLTNQILGSLIGGWSIFLPGTLLLFIVYPFWGKLKAITWTQHALTGINSTAAGLVAGIFIQISLTMEWAFEESLIFLLSIFLLISAKIPSPFILVIVGFAYWLVA